MIPGPAGELEAAVEAAEDGRWAILCHPHPLYGGSMMDAVLDIAGARFVALGGGTVRFNFRGVGASEGRHDGDREVDDVTAVARWLADHHGVDEPILIGYSFGACMAWRALGQLDAAERAVLIAPPLGGMAFPRIDGATAAVIAGTADSFVDQQELDEWIAAHPGSSLIAIDGADHFFGGYNESLADACDTAFRRLGLEVTTPRL